jgi:hypothetical protein
MQFDKNDQMQILYIIESSAYVIDTGDWWIFNVV